jgi:putative transcriptional regulator
MNNRLRVLRAERRWSQADLAQRLQVSRQSINAIETGKYDPSLPLAFKLARLFETTIEGIFTDDLAPVDARSGDPDTAALSGQFP